MLISVFRSFVVSVLPVIKFVDNKKSYTHYEILKIFFELSTTYQQDFLNKSTTYCVKQIFVH